MTALLGNGLQADWIICDSCRTLNYGKRFARELWVCHECGWHSRLTADQRVAMLLDPGSAEPVPIPSTIDDPLGFSDGRPYRQLHQEARAKTGMACGVLVVRGTLASRPLVVAVMDFRFLGGSLGSAEGEAVTVAAETALADRVPLVVVTASGGARMQEGALSLMQMAKTSNAFAALDDAGLLTVTVVTDPTYGGVTASFATLSDIVIAEPKARMGFAGPRVIEQTIRQQLPDGFQTAEYLLANGLVDVVGRRSELRQTLSRLLAAGAAPVPDGWGEHVDGALLRDPDRVPDMDAWEAVQRARHASRPTGADHIAHMLDGFVELRGDRGGEDCPALIGGLGLLDGLAVMVLCHQKGHNAAEMVARNFGMPSPGGYRKATRLMRLAAKLGVPLLTLIDTPGAFPGITAEERGQAGAIAESIRLMGSLPVPIVAVVTGEGGSGGALALGVADKVLISANGTYSVISPEGCASILWRDTGAAPTAAAQLRLDAKSLLRQGIVDAVVPEPVGGGHTDPGAASELLRRSVVSALRGLVGMHTEHLLQSRRGRFRRFGTA